MICQRVRIFRADVEKPTIDCDSDTLYVQRYMPLVDITVPMGSDNTGIQSLVRSFRLGTPIEEHKSIIFKAFDYNNNTISCVVEVRVLGTKTFFLPVNFFIHFSSHFLRLYVARYSF